MKDCPPVKFDQTIDLSVKLGIDPKKSDQQVRGTVSLPNGTGKKLRVLVLRRAIKSRKLLLPVLNMPGAEELIEKFKDDGQILKLLSLHPT